MKHSQGAHLPFPGHGACTVTFPATEHHCSLATTKLYCLMTEAHVCEQLAQSRYLYTQVVWLGVESQSRMP